MLKIIGITGGVGSGKSSVLEFLKEEYGAVIIMADDVAKRLMRAGTDCFDEIVKAFGEDIVGADGELDRELLAERIFNNPEERDLLDSIVHPAVKKDICKEIEELKNKFGDKNGLVVIEAALLIEEHYDKICDELWFVYAPQKHRIKRLKEARGYTVRKSLSIMKNQLSAKEMRRACKVTIDNSGDFEYTKSRVRAEYNRIMELE